MASYMEHLTIKQQASADLLLAGACPHSDLDTSNKPGVRSQDSDWMLPCHSIILSTHSGFFSACERNAESFCCTNSADGKRIVRIPFTEAAATKLLEHCYCRPGQPRCLSLAELCEMAVLSSMQEVLGKLLMHFFPIVCGLTCHQELQTSATIIQIRT